MKKSPEKDLAKAIQDLHKTVRTMQENIEYTHDYRYSLPESLLKGVASAVGALAAVAIVTPLVIWFLQGIQWPPLIGSWVSRIIEQVDYSRSRSLPNSADQ